MLGVADLPNLDTDLCARLRDAFRTHRYDADGVLELLGPRAHAALGRGEPELASRASRNAGPLGTLIRVFLLGEPAQAGELSAALDPLPLGEAIAGGLLTGSADRLRAALDVRPHADQETSWWVIADLDSGQLGERVPPDHVLGIGQASHSLVRATTRRPVDTLLDLGTGCGVQSLHASRHANGITATDVAPRALALAAATFRLNELDVELLEGEWFTPVARRRFDQIVCNPPFVVGPPKVDYVYRDSGLTGDDASSLLVRQLPAFLNPGGVGQLLASWLHRTGEDWSDRVRSWLPPAGLDAWFVQRDVADPGLYVGTWLRDAGIDPRSAEGKAKAAAWLDWFEANDVEGVGFGFVTFRRTGDVDGEVVCEDLRQAYDDPLGVEAAGWLDRVDWLRAHASAQGLLDARLVVADGVVLERIDEPADEGWHTITRRLHRTNGPGWRHELDELSASLLAGCRGALTLGDLLALLAAAHDQPVDELVGAALPAVRDLIRHGMLLPADGWEPSAPPEPPETAQGAP
ncbi:MAG: methyltransferase [Pseudonocardiaceae bacterium]|nr:methyltransferase [Pseudonocardiaceae bacterium]